MSKSISAAHCLLAAFCLLAPLPSAAQPGLTLDEAVALALQSNPDLAADASGVEAARAEHRAARAGYLPRVDLEHSYLAGDNPVFVFSTLLGQERFTEANFALPSLNAPSPEDNWQSRATIRQPLWDFGRTRVHREMAAVGVGKADRSHEEHRLRVVLDVIDAYYGATLAREALETARLALRSAESIEAQARARVDEGVAVEADLLRSRAYRSAVEQREIQASGALESTLARLNRLMGRPLGDPVGVTADLAPFEIELPREAALVEEQKRRRPDYAVLMAELREAELAVEARRKEFLPMLAGQGVLEMNNPSLDAFGDHNWSAGVTLSWNLSAGIADAAKLDAARHRLEQKRRQAAAMESAMALELRTALVAYRAAREQVAAARAAETESAEGLRILENRYEAGLATMTDLLSAEAARSSARTLLLEAVYRQRLGYARIEHAAGTLGPATLATLATR